MASFLSHCRSFGSYLKGVLLGKDMPVWATLLGIAGGIYGTYALLPGINRGFEQQKIRSEFVIRNLDDLNAKTRSIIGDLSKLHASIQNSGKATSSDIQAFLAKVSELQWKAIELGIIFENTTSMSLVEQYQKSLDDVRTAASNLNDKASVEKSINAIEAFSRVSIDVMKALIGISGIKSSVRAPSSR